MKGLCLYLVCLQELKESIDVVFGDVVNNFFFILYKFYDYLGNIQFDFFFYLNENQNCYYVLSQILRIIIIQEWLKFFVNVLIVLIVLYFLCELGLEEVNVFGYVQSVFFVFFNYVGMQNIVSFFKDFNYVGFFFFIV